MMGRNATSTTFSSPPVTGSIFLAVHFLHRSCCERSALSTATLSLLRDSKRQCLGCTLSARPLPELSGPSCASWQAPSMPRDRSLVASGARLLRYYSQTPVLVPGVIPVQRKRPKSRVRCSPLVPADVWRHFVLVACSFFMARATLHYSTRRKATNSGLPREELVQGQLRAPIPRQRQEQPSREAVHLADERPDDAAAVLPFDLHEKEVPGVPLDEGRDVRVPPSSDQVSFPVSRLGPSGDLGRSIVNGHSVDDLPTPLALGAGLLALSHPALSSEALDELAVKDAAGLEVEAPIDRLVRDPHLGAGVLRCEPTGDLLGRPVVLQLRRDHLPQRSPTRQQRDLRSLRTRPSALICSGCPVF